MENHKQQKGWGPAESIIILASMDDTVGDNRACVHFYLIYVHICSQKPTDITAQHAPTQTVARSWVEHY